LQITDYDNDRYEVPIPINLPDETEEDNMMEVNPQEIGDSFILNITRRSNGAQLLVHFQIMNE